jgi:6,7-dimethyl-8-ribityllumazine synthase
VTVRPLRRVSPSFSPKEREGHLRAKGLRVAVLCARWNPTVTEALLGACLSTLERHGAQAKDVTVVRVPGAFELAAAARTLIQGKRFHALVALAAIVRGETTHHEVLGHAVSHALAQLSADSGIPIGFGLLTCDTMEQARSRTGKGAEAAEAAIEMATLRRTLGGRA